MTSIVLKPWGSYEVLEKASNYLIKRLVILPSCILSLQSHLHRSEHWVVVQGKASIIIENKKIILESNNSIYVPKNAKHRISNNGLEKLIIIEVWHGEILDENDIFRYEDIYNRI